MLAARIFARWIREPFKGKPTQVMYEMDQDVLPGKPGYEVSTSSMNKDLVVSVRKIALPDKIGHHLFLRIWERNDPGSGLFHFQQPGHIFP